MLTPIELHFYDKNDDIIKTYSQSTIRWEFLKEAVMLNAENNKDEGSLELIYDFVCRFYGNKFTVKKLKKYTDVAQVTAVASQIVMRVLNMMQQEGISLPKNLQTVKKKSRILYRLIGCLKSKLL